MSEIKKLVGRPAVNAIPVTVRVPPDLLQPLDSYVADLPDTPGRPEAIRRLLRAGLEALGYVAK